MKVKDVIKQVAILLQLQNLVDANLDDYDNLEEQTKKDANLIISSLNEVLCDISIDFITLVNEETIIVENGEFELSTLEKDLHKIISINTESEYFTAENKLHIKDGSYLVKYSYLPDIKTIGSEIIEFEKLTIYALSYGVASEYCLICGNYSESEMWNSKFLKSMQSLTTKVGVFNLKSRRYR